MHCVAQAVYSEARGESEIGQRAIVHVIMNRAKNKKFPNTLCGVVKQAGQFTRKVGSGPVWKRIEQIVLHPGADPTHGALYFKAKHSAIKWGKQFVTSIGNHLFYK